MSRLVFTFLLTVVAAFGQRTPVVLVDGYHLVCENDNLTSLHDFGELQRRLESEGVQVAYFGTCSFSGKPSIEDLSTALGATIRRMNVPQVDLVSHSLGGLVVRSYLSGKQNAAGSFTPLPDTRVRKWISIATPNFGALIPTALPDFLLDRQARELMPGSQFLFDLATWNQNHDDLRGVDAIALIGNAGGFGPFEGASDGTVAVTSASLGFAIADDRTRVLPYCHGAGNLTSILGLGCDAPPLAKIQADNPLSWRIIDSFLADSEDWRTIGRSPSQDKLLSQYGGLLTQQRDNMDRPRGTLQDQNFVAQPPRAGAYTVVIDKAGPQIGLILPSAARLPALSLTPRMLISIYGNNLTGALVSVNNQQLDVSYRDDRQINALLPGNVMGLVKLSVSNDRGRQSVNIFIEDAAPAIFSSDGSGTGSAATIRTGNYISLYLTGLGTGAVTPVVTLNGVPATVTYAGPAPGFPGLDQINFELPAGMTSGTVVVRVGNHASNALTLAPG